MVLVPILDHPFQRHISVGRRVGGKEVSAAVACAHLGMPSPPLPVLPHISALALRPLAQPGLDMIDSLWPVDLMPVLSTCGR